MDDDLEDLLRDEPRDYIPPIPEPPAPTEAERDALRALCLYVERKTREREVEKDCTDGGTCRNTDELEDLREGYDLQYRALVVYQRRLNAMQVVVDAAEHAGERWKRWGAEGERARIVADLEARRDHEVYGSPRWLLLDFLADRYGSVIWAQLSEPPTTG